MQPRQTIEWAVQFAAAGSAVWLLVLGPALAVIGWRLYRRQGRAVARVHAWGLTALRALLLVLICVLAFRPSLVRRVILTFPGRIVWLIDDSASMGIVDPGLPAADALRLARAALGIPADEDAPVADLADAVLDIERELIRFERFGRIADRTRDSFWREAEAVQQRVETMLDPVAARAADGAAESGAVAAAWRDVPDACQALRAAWQPMFTGGQAPDAPLVRRQRDAVDVLLQRLQAVQEASDQVVMQRADTGLAAAVTAVRRTPRMTLLSAWWRGHRAEAIAAAADMAVQWLPLNGESPVPLAQADEPPPMTDRETDLTGTLLKWIEADDPFPLAAVVLFSDGRDLGSIPLERVTRAAVRRSVPVFCAAVGGPDEPTDLAVRALAHAPFAVRGEAIEVRVDLKSVVERPETVALELVTPEPAVLAAEPIEVAPSRTHLRHRLEATPAQSGVQRWTARVGGIDGEVVPHQNNQRDLIVHVRDEKVRVLLLDWRPRWQTRFILNILQRLEFIDLNALIGLTRGGGELPRGIGQGEWPADAATLQWYDLVILGDLPDGWLHDDDWRMVQHYVETGGTLAWLAAGNADPVPPALASSLLPLQPRTDQTAPMPADLGPLALTETGWHHPVTRSLRGAASRTATPSAERLMPESLPLLQTEDGLPVIAARFVGDGKTVLFDSDRLWRRLNAGHLDAHAEMVIGLIAWAVAGRAPDAGQPRPDLDHADNRESIQVWVAGREPGTPVVLRDGERMRTAVAQPVHPAARMAAAVFASLPPGDWMVSGSDESSEPAVIRSVDRSREFHDLARHDAWLETLAAETGGRMRPLVEAHRLMADIEPRQRIERHEATWRLWDSPWVLAGLILALTLEWVWRKLAGLV